MSSGRMSDVAVAGKTGKTWTEWFQVLDAAGAREMSLQQIVAVVGQQHGVPGWWQQTVAVTYEQERGLRERFQSCDGAYQAGATKVVAASVDEVFTSWHDAGLRGRWLPGAQLTVRKATPGKSLRITWCEDNTHVDVNLYPKGERKSQVQVGHTKLGDAEHALRMTAFWGEALTRLKQVLETDAPKATTTKRATGTAP